ncbi:MAG: caspase family protein [Roseofilum sp. SBFL]|uniref:caspase family protein n=1 Tax=unclassified Roseofilum TaxID=2620099 RepID=UPI001B09CE30|nr:MULTISPECIES: caspase family protein [unclassified Roseofilum]MBP0012474.1 caspase family protein [Roseofilum sp. SID3]MBP0025130.1 caspase family protein [Roseofilum sp. SID2]MBP0037617.1 caspase family protein [Roseofilum sp. SID1]MBP0041825.1 caspase family protein [Roseofilum sp. SBFL]
MGKTRAIAIGINQYQYFQPLSYAQQDAQAFCDFWTYQAGLSLDQCLLLSEVSQPIQGESTYPDRPTIEGWIEKISSGNHPQFQFDPEDRLWLFFSGYGSSVDGIDYLMPIDSDPNQVSTTGISMAWLFNSLANLPTQNLLVVLDMNRPSSLQIGGLLGNQTANLARELEIATLLSCQPGQFSQETLELRQGLFTAALLEGLRSGQCSTLASLDHYLHRRLMELSDQHNRPNQQALMVVNPPGRVHRVILPIEETETEEALSQSSSTAEPLSVPSGSGVIPQPSPVAQKTSTDIHKPMEPDKKPQSQDPKSNEEDAQFWRLLILAWGGIALILIGGVFLRNRNALTTVETPPSPAVTEPVAGSPAPTPAASPSEVVVIPAPANSPVAATPAPSPAVPQAPATVATPAPAPQPQPVSAPTLTQVTSILGSQQASLYVKAIEEARKISADNPNYAEAQGKIELWSQAIMDIAMGRAAQGQFEGAIAAAQLVPPEVSAYSAAQSSMTTWQQQAAQAKANQVVIQQASSKIKANQASSYNQAIAQVKTIGADQPRYNQAQALANQWSNEILKIAYRRLASDGPAQAIAAAELVPENTAAYAEAQRAIAVWQTRS